jgi:hypothetical protein
MKTEESKLEAQQEQLHIPVVMHSILIKVITEAYRIGYDDGYADIYNAEFVGEDQSKLMPIEGEEKVVSELLKKYCA